MRVNKWYDSRSRCCGAQQLPVSCLDGFVQFEAVELRLILSSGRLDGGGDKKNEQKLSETVLALLLLNWGTTSHITRQRVYSCATCSVSVKHHASLS